MRAGTPPQEASGFGQSVSILDHILSCRLLGKEWLAGDDECSLDVWRRICVCGTQIDHWLSSPVGKQKSTGSATIVVRKTEEWFPTRLISSDLGVHIRNKILVKSGCVTLP